MSMHQTNLSVDLTHIAHWFNAIRNLDDRARTRALEGFWDTQLSSKAWLVNELNSLVDRKSNVYIFGGWIGVLGSMLLQRCEWVDAVRSIDIDATCESIADTVCKPYEMQNWRFKAQTGCMSAYEYASDRHPHVVINTSTEHVSQEVYNAWYDKIPHNTLVVAQGNNFYSCPEHVRCAANLEEFCAMHRVVDPLYCGSLPNSQYTRWMCIWRKHG